ncbi:EAL domain-containing protein [Clostridium scatologenes]|uniref:Diguanylate cyclase/phosphodiesterase with PAS/PAC sensor(S) n=1 Tax=Clostridium scatologenes TaxID=1548 RepID=A0A0E3K0V2_CLOSL|nr:EAL domain-containing protein [Clostridium scatologenes]AKA69358.1 diguanylate cyclase/phosphodiesterase with PAS/PAC sensor(s) [Clostridium scatologenes]
MSNSKYQSKKAIINKYKLIYIPLFIGLLSIFSISLISYHTSKDLILTQMKQDGVNLAKQTVLQVELNANSLEIINKLIEDRIRKVGKVVIMDQNSLSNNLLKELGNDLDVSEINWFSPEGTIIYSNVDRYLGWKPTKNHPVENFRLGSKTEYMEGIRMDTESFDYKKYGYFKNSDGTFIQIGITANEVETLTQKFNYQTLVEKLTSGENVLHVIFVDKNLKTIADSDKKQIGTIYDKNKETEMQEALKGNIAKKDSYYKKEDIKALTIYVPVVTNGNVNNVLILSLSTEKVYKSIYMLAIKSSIIAIIMILLLLWAKNRNIIKPVNRLNKSINGIDIEKHLDYRLPLTENDTFFVLASSINNILNKTSSYFYELKENQEELKASNEEISATYQQLAASEEELRAQYEEIQSYTEKLESLRQKYEIAIEGTNSAVWEFDIENESIHFLEGFKNIIGKYTEEKENIYETLKRFLNEEDEENLIKEIASYIKNQKEEIHTQVQIKDGFGNLKWVLIRGKGIFDSNNKIKLINGIVLDISSIKEQEEYIRHIAYHDSLTNLPNRRKLMAKLEEDISKNKYGALMLLDLDNFKGINDTLGHLYGDKVLKIVSEKLESIKDEKIFVSRFGGDEFLILIEDEKNIDIIENYAKKIINVFKNKLIIEGQEIYLSCSMGISLYPFDSNKVSQLLMNADMAMYKVKNKGKDSYMFFNEEMTEKLQEKIKVESILRDAIKKEKLKLLYQPQVCTFTGKVVGFEALLRLKDKHISPAQFIPVAEETGLIIEIGRWVTKEAINQIRIWKKKGMDIKPISINFSPKQLNDLNYIEFLENTLKECNVESKYIEIEITESIFLEEKEKNIAFVNRLKSLGIKISLDDFGTGYSSLNYLTFLPVDKIKLDKSLNDKFLEFENIKVIDSLISLTKSLNLEVIAEGIENVAQYKRLKSAGCHYIQGYLFSKPLEVEEAEKIYDNNFLDSIEF